MYDSSDCDYCNMCVCAAAAAADAAAQADATAVAVATVEAADDAVVSVPATGVV